jgi:hypothetical protein
VCCHVVNDSPQPHVPLALGLTNTNSDLQARGQQGVMRRGEGMQFWGHWVTLLLSYQHSAVNHH